MICACCPTRGREDEARDLLQSFLDTQTGNSKLVFYVDQDQTGEYARLLSDPRAQVMVGPRIGMAPSVNAIVKREMENCSGFGLAVDDSRFLTQGWDRWVEQALDNLPGRIGVISAHHEFGHHVNFPYVSREWVEAVGYVAYPELRHYCWDSMLELMGEATAIRFATKDEFSMSHKALPGNADLCTRDAVMIIHWVVHGYRKSLDAVRSAIPCPAAS